MARHDNGTIRKEAYRGSPAPADTGVGDSDFIRPSGVRRRKTEPPISRNDINPLARAKADFVGRFMRYNSTRGRIPSQSDIRFQPIVDRDTHQRIREARRRLKDGPLLLPFRSSEIPAAVAVDFTRIHAHNCEAYEVLKHGKRKKS